MLHEPSLQISDPETLRYMLVTAPHAFQKPPEVISGPLGDLFGGGLLVAEGDEHTRQRRIMGPSFTAPAINALAPIMQRGAREPRTVWTRRLEEHALDDASPLVLDVTPSVSRYTLEVIIEAAFGETAGTLETGEDHALATAFSKLVRDAQTTDLIAQFTMQWALPERAPGLLGWVRHAFDYLLVLVAVFMPSLIAYLPENAFGRQCRVVEAEARKLIERRRDALRAGSDNPDLLSSLLRSVDDPTAKLHMSEYELRGQVKTMLVRLARRASADRSGRRPRDDGDGDRLDARTPRAPSGGPDSPARGDPLSARARQLARAR